MGLHFLFGQVNAFFGLNDGGDYLAVSFVRNAYDSHVLDLGLADEHGFQVDGEDVFAATDNQVFLPVDIRNEPLLILPDEVAGIEPAVP